MLNPTSDINPLHHYKEKNMLNQSLVIWWWLCCSWALKQALISLNMFLSQQISYRSINLQYSYIRVHCVLCLWLCNQFGRNRNSTRGRIALTFYKQQYSQFNRIHKPLSLILSFILTFVLYELGRVSYTRCNGAVTDAADDFSVAEIESIQSRAMLTRNKSRHGQRMNQVSDSDNGLNRDYYRMVTCAWHQSAVVRQSYRATL